jgi:hypothetical protein
VKDLPDFKDVWVLRDGRTVAEGDAATIDTLLGDLDRVAHKDGGWTSLHQHRKTGEFWELSYPQSQMHGGGPRRLRQMNIAGPEDWSHD